jgi:hypothetical protein
MIRSGIPALLKNFFHFIYGFIPFTLHLCLHRIVEMKHHVEQKHGCHACKESENKESEAPFA